MRKILTVLFLCSLLASVSAPPARAEGPAYYVVKPGEGLWSIAIRYGTTIESIVQANRLVNPNWIYAGQVIVLPKGTPDSSGSSEFHTVVAGESIWSIAAQYGVSAWSIVTKNSIANPDLIYVGQTLSIPGASSGSVSGTKPTSPTSVPPNVPVKIAARPYASTSFGFDISFPQCRTPFPGTEHAFAVVGVNGGRAFRANTCFATQYDWAAKTSGISPSIYMNLSYPMGSSAVNALDGPAGRCGASDQVCKSYNFGYNAARYSFNYADKRTAQIWWLDVELSNSWSARPSLNARVIQGAVDFFQSKGIIVGAYSSATQWSKIAGAGFKPKFTIQPSLANWIFGAKNRADAATYCSADHAFGGGTVWLVQYPSGGFDGNYVC